MKIFATFEGHYAGFDDGTKIPINNIQATIITEMTYWSDAKPKADIESPAELAAEVKRYCLFLVGYYRSMAKHFPEYLVQMAQPPERGE